MFSACMSLCKGECKRRIRAFSVTAVLMLAAVAAGEHASLAGAMTAMARDREVTNSTTPAVRGFHRAKRDIYGAMRRLERDARAVMAR